MNNAQSRIENYSIISGMSESELVLAKKKKKRNKKKRVKMYNFTGA